MCVSGCVCNCDCVFDSALECVGVFECVGGEDVTERGPFFFCQRM